MPPTSPHGLGTPMLAGKLPESPSRGAGYTSPLRASQQSIGAYKAAGTGYTSPRAEHDRQRSSQQHLTPRAGSPQPMRSPANFCAGPTAKLEHVAERFSAFYSDLEQEKQQRKIQESARFQTLMESIAKLEKSVEAEVKRRTDADRQIQSHFDSEVKSLQERMNSNYAELSGAFKTSLEGLARTVQDLHGIIKEEREQRRADIEHLAGSLVNKVNECVAAIDEERVARVEMETKTVRQVGQDLLRLQERLETEKNAREGDVNQLRSEVHEVLGNRNMTDEKFQAVVLDEIAALKTSLAVEREERVAEDDEIVAAVNDYTRALQDGLRIIANN